MIFGRKDNLDHLAPGRLVLAEKKIAELEGELDDSQEKYDLMKGWRDNGLESVTDLNRRVSRLTDDNNDLTDRCARQEEELDKILGRQIDMQKAKTTEDDNERLRCLNNKKAIEICGLNADIKVLQEVIAEKDKRHEEMQKSLEITPEDELKICQGRVMAQAKLKEKAEGVCDKFRKELNEIQGKLNFSEEANRNSYRDIQILDNTIFRQGEELTRTAKLSHSEIRRREKAEGNLLRLRNSSESGEYRREIESLKKVIRDRSVDRTSLESRIVRLIRNNSDLATKAAGYAGTAEAHKENVITLSKENVGLRGALNTLEKDGNRDELLEKIRALKLKLADPNLRYMSNHSNCTVEIERLQSQRDAAVQEAAILRLCGAGANRTITAQEQTISILQRDYSRLNEKLTVLRKIESLVNEEETHDLPGPEGAR